MLQLKYSGVVLFCMVNAFLNAQTADQVLPPEKIIKLIPDRIKGFEQLDDPKATQTKLGTITYSLCEKKFSDGRKSIKILLFDYKEAPIMYSQAMRQWSNNNLIETDTLVSRSLAMQNCSGWESYNQRNKTSQIFLGICDRYFLIMTGENVDLEVLKKALLQIPTETFVR